MKKKIDELTINDFNAYPIWTWADDDESLVAPLINIDSIEDQDSLFVSAIFELNDGSKQEGFIAIRIIDYFVYLISLSNDKGVLIDYPLLTDMYPFAKKDEIAKHLKKLITEIFPLNYCSQVFLPNAIKGIVY